MRALSLGSCGISINTHTICGSLIMSSTDVPDFLDGVEECRPENITLLVVENTIYMSWDIQYFNMLGCPFLVTVWNCFLPDAPFTCTVRASHQHIRRLSLNQCLERGYSYHDGTVIDIKWDNDECVEGDNGCSYDIYIPKVTETG